jgi:hypothetical protein
MGGAAYCWHDLEAKASCARPRQAYEEPGDLGWVIAVSGAMAARPAFGVQMLFVTIKCPGTGLSVSTGIAMDAASFAQLPAIASRVLCPHCRGEHEWLPSEAWLDRAPSPEAPLAWLDFNNRFAPND